MSKVKGRYGKIHPVCSDGQLSPIVAMTLHDDYNDSMIKHCAECGESYPVKDMFYREWEYTEEEKKEILEEIRDILNDEIAKELPYWLMMPLIFLCADCARKLEKCI